MNAPTLPAYPYRDGLKVWCQYCEQWHIHGEGEGHRAAHCMVENSPYLQGGYDLELVATPPPCRPLRTTPSLCSRDDAIFPSLAEAHQRHGAPKSYHLKVGKKYVRITADYFFVPPEIEENLKLLVTQYIEWRLAKKLYTKGSHLVTLTGVHDYATIEVLREHAEWWIELFNQAAVFTYNPWREEAEQLRKAS